MGNYFCQRNDFQPPRYLRNAIGLIYRSADVFLGPVCRYVVPLPLPAPTPAPPSSSPLRWNLAEDEERSREEILRENSSPAGRSSPSSLVGMQTFRGERAKLYCTRRRFRNRENRNFQCSKTWSTNNNNYELNESFKYIYIYMYLIFSDLSERSGKSYIRNRPTKRNRGNWIYRMDIWWINELIIARIRSVDGLECSFSETTAVEHGPVNRAHEESHIFFPSFFMQ